MADLHAGHGPWQPVLIIVVAALLSCGFAWFTMGFIIVVSYRNCKGRNTATRAHTMWLHGTRRRLAIKRKISHYHGLGTGRGSAFSKHVLSVADEQLARAYIALRLTQSCVQ